MKEVCLIQIYRIGHNISVLQGSFDGDSLNAAELLFKNGFKEAYAIKGGLRGKNGWQVIFLLF